MELAKRYIQGTVSKYVLGGPSQFSVGKLQFWLSPVFPKQLLAEGSDGPVLGVVDGTGISQAGDASKLIVKADQSITLSNSGRNVPEKSDLF